MYRTHLVKLEFYFFSGNKITLTSRKKSSGEFQDRRSGKEIFNEINLIVLIELFLPLHTRTENLKGSW